MNHTGYYYGCCRWDETAIFAADTRELFCQSARRDAAAAAWDAAERRRHFHASHAILRQKFSDETDNYDETSRYTHTLFTEMILRHARSAWHCHNMPPRWRERCFLSIEKFVASDITLFHSMMPPPLPCRRRRRRHWCHHERFIAAAIIIDGWHDWYFSLRHYWDEICWLPRRCYYAITLKITLRAMTMMMLATMRGSERQMLPFLFHYAALACHCHDAADDDIVDGDETHWITLFHDAFYYIITIALLKREQSTTATPYAERFIFAANMPCRCAAAEIRFHRRHERRYATPPMITMLPLRH